MKPLQIIKLLALAGIFSVAAPAQKPAEPYVRGELLVKIRKGAEAQALRTFESVSAAVVERFADTGWLRVKIDDGLDPRSAAGRFAELPAIEAAQPNYYYHLLATPNDPQFPAGLWGMTKISAPAAWDTAVGSAQTVVAVIDTGIKYDHEDLAANVWTNSGEAPGNGIDDDGNGFVDDFYGYDFFFNDPDPLDEHGHGTHVSGTIGAVGNNGIGVVGVNWNVKIMTIKIYNSSGWGTTSGMLINAYNYVRMMRERGVNIRVTNNSYGGCTEACGYDQATKDALDALGNSGVLNVFAAGNDARNIDVNPSYPASYDSPTILSVASSTSTDTRSSFSNWGTTGVDVAAPGSGILSTVRSAANYGTLSGTSMASPHVAGAAALLSSHDPSLSAASLKATLMNTVDPLSGWTDLVRSGGRLNVAAAVNNPTVCSYSLPSSSATVGTKGGYVAISVTAPQNCDFIVKSRVNWISVADALAAGGGTQVRVRVGVNTALSRSGVVEIAGTVNSCARFSNF